MPLFVHKTPIPTDEDLSHVHPSTTKLLCPDLLPADKMYNLVMKEKIWSSWSGDSHGIRYLDVSKDEGDDSQTKSEALKNVALDDTDILATSDGDTPTALDDILDTTLSDDGTLALVAGSPAIDAGMNSGDLPANDLAGNERIIDCVDIGAYESEFMVAMECLTGSREVVAGKVGLSPNPAKPGRTAESRRLRRDAGA